MTVAVIFILAVLWVAVLAPPILKAKGRQAQADSVGSFSHQLGLLGRANGAPRSRPARRSAASLMGPRSSDARQMTPTQRRRRDVLLALVAAAVLSLTVAFATGASMLWFAHVLVDMLLAGYVLLLVQYQQRTRGVRHLAPLTQARAVGRVYQLGPHREGLMHPAPRLVPLRQTVSR